MLTITLTFKTIEAARAALFEIPSSSLVGGDAAEQAPAPAAPSKSAAKTAAAIPPGKQLRQPNHTDDKNQITSAGAAGVLEDVPAPKPEPVATTSSAKPSASVDYPTLQKAVFALAGKSRGKATALVAQFGVKTFKELPEAKWGDALTAVNAALAEAA